MRLPFTLLFCWLTLCLHAQSTSPDSLPRRDTLIETRGGELPDTMALGGYNAAYYPLERLNTGLPERPADINLRTPQGALEFFTLTVREGNFARAAYALNLNLLPSEVQQAEAAVLAEKLYYVLSQRVSIDWGGLPDRPDGQINMAGAGQEAIAGTPQRSISFGRLTVGGREVPLYLQRVRVGERAPVWLVAPSTVENIEALYANYGPTWLDRRVPDWADREVLGISLWKAVAMLLLGGLCYLLYFVFRYATRRLLRRSDNPWLTDLSENIA